MNRLTITLIIAITTPSALAGAYKCNIDGKITYQSTPCPTENLPLEVKPETQQQQIKREINSARTELRHAEGQLIISDHELQRLERLQARDRLFAESQRLERETNRAQRREEIQRSYDDSRRSPLITRSPAPAQK